MATLIGMSNGAMSDQQLKEMLDTNRSQREYYETCDGHTPSKGNTWGTNIWRVVRSRALSAIPPSIGNVVYSRHSQWIGSPSGLKVLELGCGSGTSLSEYLAQSAREYHAIDLSSTKIAALRSKLGGSASVKLHVGDFLASSFSERDFDLVYAHSVLHHFKFFCTALDRVDSVLSPTGRLITYDPIQTWLPARVLRLLYRPFQADRDWEFPFDGNALAELDRRYCTLDSFGVFGRCKWALAIALFAPKLGQRLGNRWFAADLLGEATSPSIRKCLHASFHLRRR